jgi:hypothetical protein
LKTPGDAFPSCFNIVWMHVKSHSFVCSAHEPSAFRVLRPKGLEMVGAQPPVLEVYLDHGIRNERLDLRPTLPLVIVR